MSLWEAEQKVYFIPDGADESFLLYDFSLNVGEETTVYMPVSGIRPIDVVKEKERVVCVDGVERHCSLIRAYWGDSNCLSAGWWIEGVGSILSPLTSGSSQEGIIEQLIECTVNGDTIYTGENNPVEELNRMLTNDNQDNVSFPVVYSKSFNNQYYDLSGRRLSAPLAKGVYIENGKKRVAK
ncbi:MAG: hypothetical protein J5486_11490 [Bacteroidaceae bacterium]|nr:hypothetical protein [Bacteroidaceae bacterium]